MFLLQLVKHTPCCKIDEFASPARRNQRNCVKSAQEQLPGLNDDQTLPVSFYEIEIFCLVVERSLHGCLHLY